MADLNSFPWMDVAGLLTSIGGGALSAGAAGKTSSQLNQLLGQLQGQLPGYTFAGPGGQTGFLNPQSGTAGFGLGNLDTAYNALSQYGLNGVNAAQGAGNLPAGLTQAGAGVAGAVPGSQFQPGLTSAAFGGANQFLQNVGQNNSQLTGLASNALAGANTQVGAAGQNYQDVFNSTLNNLRANAAPQNLLAANGLQDSLFGTGRLGTTGGGNLATAFARGLAQADAGYQLQAQQQAMAQQQNALGLAQGLAGIGNGALGLNANLQQNNLGLAQGLAGIGSGITALGENLNQGLFNRQQGNFNTQATLAQLPLQLQQQQLGLGLAGIAGANQLNQSGLNNFQAALQAAVAQSNARNQTANAQASLGATRAQTPTSADTWGSILTGIGTRLADPNSSLNNLLGGLFGGSSGFNSSGLESGIDAALNNAGFGNNWTTQPIDFSGLFTGQNFNTSPIGNGLSYFNGAGGQAANIASGLTDLGSVFGNATQNLSNDQLNQYLGTGSAWNAIQNANTGGLTAGQVIGKAGSALGGAANIYGGIQQGGTAGAAQAATGAIQAGKSTGLLNSSLAGDAAAYVGIGSQLAQGNYGGAGFAAADALMGGPYAAIGNAVASIANHAFFSDGSKDRNVQAYSKATNSTPVALQLGKAGKNYDIMPNGDGTYRLINASDFNDLAGSWYGTVFHPDGNQSEWQQKYLGFVNNLQSADLPKGYSFDPSTGKIMYKGKVAGNYGG